MFRKLLLAASVSLIGASAAVAAPASLASLSSAQGSVLIERSGKYLPASSVSSLRAGDRVVAMRGGKANLSYADGCQVSVEARTSHTVGASACGGSSIVKTSMVSQDGYGAGGASAVGGADLWMFLGFGLLTVGVAASALDEDEKPVSP